MVLRVNQNDNKHHHLFVCCCLVDTHTHTHRRARANLLPVVEGTANEKVGVAHDHFFRSNNAKDDGDIRVVVEREGRDHASGAASYKFIEIFV